MPTMDRSKKTKNRMRSRETNTPRHTVCKNKNSAANARIRWVWRSEYSAQARNSTAVSATSGRLSPSTPMWYPALTVGIQRWFTS